jgi:microcystin degradation protein MlrC
MRVAIGRFWTESSTMSPLHANRQMFEAGALVEGEALLQFAQGTRTELGGFIAELDQTGSEIVALIAAQAACAGPIEAEFWNWFRERLTKLLQEAMPVDAVLLSLHGATLAEDEDDCCGALVASARALVGPEIPIIATLDMHGNPTHQLAVSGDGLVAYKTYPHHDFVERGQQAARIALSAARGEVSPVVEVVTLPMGLGSLPLMNDLIAQANEFEREAGVLCCSIMPTHPHLDVEEFHPLSAVVVTDNDRTQARDIAVRLMAEAWRQRDRAVVETPQLVPLPDAIQTALLMPSGTVVIADRLDAVTGGFPGDCPEVIRCLLVLGIPDPSCHILTDPAFVERAMQTGVGGTVEGPLGGAWGASLYQPVEVSAKVRALSDGRLQKSRESRPGHLEISNRSMGKTAVVEIESGITVVMTSVPVMSTEPTVFRSVGVEPYEHRIVVTKSVNQQRFHFTEAVGFIDLASPGWGSAEDAYTWTKRNPKNIFPYRDVSQEEVNRWLMSARHEEPIQAV